MSRSDFPKKFPHKLQTRSVSHYTCNNITNGSILVSLHWIDRYIIDLLSTNDLWWFSHCFCGLWFPSLSHRTQNSSPMTNATNHLATQYCPLIYTNTDTFLRYKILATGITGILIHRIPGIPGILLAATAAEGSIRFTMSHCEFTHKLAVTCGKFNKYKLKISWSCIRISCYHSTRSSHNYQFWPNNQTSINCECYSRYGLALANIFHIYNIIFFFSPLTVPIFVEFV